MEFPIALVTIAAFLFLTGVVGHDTEAGGKLALKVNGKVGPLPRVVLVVASALTLALALTLYLVELSEAQPVSPVPDPTTTAPAPVSTSTQPQQPVPQVPHQFTLLAGIRPELGQVAESATLFLDGQAAASWAADQTSPGGAIVVPAEPGVHAYAFDGVYGYVDAYGQVLQAPFLGSGSITVVDGGRYTVSYDATTGTFHLVPAP